MLRWAWRLFRREWRQQILTLVLIAVAVASAILGMAIGSNTPLPSARGFGSATVSAVFPGNDQNLTADLAAVSNHFGTTEVIQSADLNTGSATTVEIRAEAPNGVFGHSMLKVVSGRFPTGAGQVAVTRQLANRYNLHIGDSWTAPGGGSAARTVVGIVEDPLSLTDEFALVAPGQIARATKTTVLFDGNPSALTSFDFPSNSIVNFRPPPAGRLSGSTVTLLLVTIGLVFVGLVSVAGFAVMAQRRMRSFGMIASLGATDGDIRSVMVANGAVIGLAGTLIGALLGFAGWFAYAPELQDSANHLIDPWNLPWVAIAAAMVLAVATATLAAGSPARAAARVPILAALSGRAPHPRPSRRSALPGIAIMGAGLAILYLAAPGTGASGRSGLLVVGALAIIVGGLLFAPLAISGLSRAAGLAPVPVRLAWRDLGRYRFRSGASLGAVGLAVTISTIICLAAATRSSNVLDYIGPNLATNQLVVDGPGPEMAVIGGKAPAPPSSVPQSELQARVGSIASALDTNDVLGLVESPLTLNRTTNPGFQNFNGAIYVATPQLIARYRLTIPPGVDVVTSRPGLDAVAHLTLVNMESLSGPGRGAALPCVPGNCIAHPLIEETHALPTGTEAPDVVVTEAALQQLGVSSADIASSPQAWLIQTPKKLTSVQTSTAEALAAEVGMTVRTRNSEPSLSSLETWATAGGMLLAVGILIMTSGLIRSETAGDLRTLAATGASSRARRTITAATTGGIGLLGGVLGTAIGLAGIITFYRQHLDSIFARLPVHDLLLLALGLPLAAAVAGWLVSGRQPPVISRQPLE